MITYRANILKVIRPDVTDDPHRSLTTEWAELNRLREEVRLAELKAHGRRKRPTLLSARWRVPLL
jgi:hypothetical protein